MAGPFEYVLTRSVCRGVRAACAPRRACGPANASLGSPAHAQIRGLTRQLAGLRAYQGADVHVQGFACDQHTAPGTVVPKTQTTSAATPIFNVFHRGGLRFGHLTTPNRDITATKRGDLHH